MGRRPPTANRLPFPTPVYIARIFHFKSSLYPARCGSHQTDIPTGKLSPATLRPARTTGRNGVTETPIVAISLNSSTRANANGGPLAENCDNSRSTSCLSTPQEQNASSDVITGSQRERRRPPPRLNPRREKSPPAQRMNQSSSMIETDGSIDRCSKVRSAAFVPRKGSGPNVGRSSDFQTRFCPAFSSQVVTRPGTVSYQGCTTRQWPMETGRIF